MSNNPEIIIDLTYLIEVASDNTEFMVEMIDLFLAQTPSYLANLEAAVMAKDFKSIAEAAHKIKPTLTFMGVNSARETMASIETRARSQEDYEGILNDYNGLKETFKTIYTKLEEKKAELLLREN